MALFELTKDEGVAVINMANGANKQNLEFAKGLNQLFDEILIDTEIYSIIITSSDEKNFCQGIDIDWLMEKYEQKDFKSMKAFIYAMNDVFKRLLLMPVPVIAAINGHAFGNGAMLACACDFRFSSENATFGCAFTRIGLSPDSSTSFHLPKLVGLSLAYEMLFLNRTINAQEAFQYRLVNKIFSSEGFMDEAKKVAIQLSYGAPIAFAFTKKLLNESFTNNLSSHLDREAEQIAITAETEDFQEGLRAFFEKRTPNFTGK